MNPFRRFFLWYALLTKRLVRRPAFLILLLCVPLLAGAMAAVAKQDSSIVTVALVCDTDDPAARRAADRLLRADSLVRCYSWVTGQFETNASYANIIQWMTEGHFVGYCGPIDHLLAGREATLKAQETLAHSIDTIFEIRFGKQPVYLIAQSYTNRKGFRRAYVSASTIAALSLRLLPFFFDGTEIAGNNEFIDEANVHIGDLFKWDEKNRLFYAYQVDDSSRLIPGQYTIYKLGEKNFVKQ